jgi:hypothetical protein
VSSSVCMYAHQDVTSLTKYGLAAAARMLCEREDSCERFTDQHGGVRGT